MKSLKEMEKYATDNYVPIIRGANIEYLEALIKRKKLYNILELGSAIGYSAIRMALVDKKVHVTTIERDEKMFLMAKENIADMKLENQVDIIYDDIFNVELEGKYDLIFIDAAKAQYEKFFNKFKDNLTDFGYIVSDNLELLDLQKLTQSKRSMRLVKKMGEYKDFLDSLEDFYTQYLSIGDGFAITRKCFYKEILKDEYFIDSYRKIEDIKKDFPVNHGFIHINNVIKNAKNIAKVFNFDNYKRELLMIACCLHDLGYLISRDNHPQIGADLASEYLFAKGYLSEEEISCISSAIANHGGKLDSDYLEDISFALVLADKMDFSKTRYNNDIEKYPKVEPYLMINEIDLIKEDEKYFLLVKANENYQDNESSINYFEKLNKIFSKLEEVRKIKVEIKLVKE